MLVDEILSGVNIKQSPISNHAVEQLRNAGKFAIWGGGEAAQYAAGFLQKQNLKPSVIVDSFSHVEDEYLYNIPFISSQDFFEKYRDYPVLVCCSELYGIPDLLERKHHKAITWDTTLVDNFKNQQPLDVVLQKEKDKIDEVYRLLVDEKSRTTFANVLKYRLSLEKNFLEDIYEENYYFGNDVIPEVDCVTFVDCGAFTGDTLAQFYMAEVCKCKKYYALEPDKNLCSQIESYSEEKGLRDVCIIPTAVHREKGILRFHNTSFGHGRIASDGGSEVQADSLEHIVKTEDRPVGFIKMDIEGSEIPALEGAEKMIRDDQPVLAISVYHHREDLWEIPLMIHKMNSNYKLYMRHHTMTVCDTVCYAVP